MRNTICVKRSKIFSYVFSLFSRFSPRSENHLDAQKKNKDAHCTLTVGGLETQTHTPAYWHASYIIVYLRLRGTTEANRPK